MKEDNVTPQFEINEQNMEDHSKDLEDKGNDYVLKINGVANGGAVQHCW